MGSKFSQGSRKAMEEMAARPAPIFLYDSLIVVLVGREEERFNLHKDLLCQSSDFFKAALCGRFQEANGTVKLPEEDPAVFRFFVHWLYTGKLRGYHYPSTFKPTLDELRQDLLDEVIKGAHFNQYDLPLQNSQRQAYNSANYHDVPFSKLIGLYVMADMLQVRNLKDLIVNFLIDNYDLDRTDDDEEAEMSGTDKHLFWSDAATELGLENPAVGINLAWTKMPHDSHICQLTLLLFCNNVEMVNDQYSQAGLDMNFLLAAAQLFTGRWFHGRKAMKWGIEELCNLHEHDVGLKCPCPHLDDWAHVWVPDDHESLKSAKDIREI